MRAVWSFWTKPFQVERRSSWRSERHHWLAWGLSIASTSRFYPDTCLVTDDEGARILIDELQLPFRSVSTALNGLAAEDPGWWALGKLAAYRQQRAPFVHIDTDVFLWEPFGPRLESADVFAQCPEPIDWGATCYRPEELEQAIGRPGGGWLPPEWRWFRNSPQPHAECCGVFGGNRVDFILHFAAQAMRMVTGARNREALHAYPGKIGQMILLEQYLLSACVEYHRARAGSRFEGVEIRYVFEPADAEFEGEAPAPGFTHLAGDAKRNRRIAQRLEQRVRRDLPGYYERCMQYAAAGQWQNGRNRASEP